MADERNGLAARLRLETQAVHVEAERSGYVRKILERRASLRGYALFLGNLQPAYLALERALVLNEDHPVLAPFAWRPLFRSEAIGGDLDALMRAGGGEIPTLLPEGRAYADRIEAVGADDPARLLGHAYVRYIGDLSGGQIVKRLLETSPGLSPAMLGFYDFPGIADAGAYKEGFRRALDRAGGTAGDVEAIVEEAKRAFALNIAVSMAVLDRA